MPSANAELVEQDSIGQWADLVTSHLEADKATAVGLMNGSPNPIEAGVLEKLVASVANSLDTSSTGRRLLLVKLDVYHSKNLDRADDQPATIPVALRSPLGPWSEVHIPMPVGSRASWSLEQIPAWMPVWKQAFDFVIVALGPIDQVPSRVIGKFCHNSYIILGPNSSCSATWLRKHIEWHRQSGASVHGTLVASWQPAA